LGEWLLENHSRIDIDNLNIILIGKKDYLLEDYRTRYLSFSSSILEDKELSFLNLDFLKGDFPYFYIELLELKEGELIQSISIKPGNKSLMSNQLDSFFRL
tara:strand:- start:244 stop:546 length:303 start_codon:yes stop_codon:yes gene_type:complete